MKRLALCLCLCLLLCACAAPAAGEMTLTDMLGREVPLAGPAKRVVALSPADCEILCAIGAADVLVGRGAYCDYPASVQDLPALQSGAQINMEEIVALKPDAVIMSTMDQTEAQAEALAARGTPVVVTDAQNVADVYAAMALLGSLTGHESEAAACVADMRAAFEKASAGRSDAGSVYFEVSPLQWGLWAAGSGTFMDEIAGMVGLTNIFADVEGWKEVSAEQVVMRDPDYIITIAMTSETEDPAEEIKARAGWGNIAAVQNDRVFRLDADMLSRPGPRLGEAALALRALLP